jgi:hypothetical protein
MLHLIEPQIGASHEAELNRLLGTASESLDIPASTHQLATDSYEAVGRWLSEEDSPLTQFSPQIYPQGSFALGTAVKPLGRDAFDFDATCCLNIPGFIGQRQLKILVGQRLHDHEVYRNMLEEKNRCWCLNYANFHLDIIPAKPQPSMPSQTALLITDKEYKFWKDTDPKGYIRWFKERKRIILNASLTALNRMAASIEPAPMPADKCVKSPLQVAIQLLKRHRDVTFKGRDDAPISIIISTLSGHAYQGEEGIVAALRGLAERMPTYIETVNDHPCIANPTNPKENFADKWAKHPEREHAFHEWIGQLRKDVSSLANIRGLNAAAPILNRFLGEKRSKLVLQKFAEPVTAQRQSGLTVNLASGALASVGPVVRRNTFYGD